MPAQLPHELSILAHAQTELAQANTVDEVKNVRDKAEAARKYAQCAQLGLETQNQCAEIKLRAERKAGNLLAKLRLHPGRPKKKKKSHDATILASLCINKSQSSRWQAEAAVPEDVFQKYLAIAKECGKEVTAQGLLRLAQRHKESRKTGQTVGRATAKTKGRNVDQASDEPNALVAELVNQHELLGSLLEEFCAKEVVRSETIQRRMVARLIADMRETLLKLSEQLDLSRPAKRSGPTMQRA
jgi:hypothetical protein